MPRQPYSAAVQSDGEERLHPLPSEKGRGLERDVELPLAKGRRRDSKKIYFSFQKLFQSIFPFLYHTTITLAFSSQESSICLSLQFSERSFSKDLSFSSSLSRLAKSRADWLGEERGIFLPTLSSMTADMPQASKQRTGKQNYHLHPHSL